MKNIECFFVFAMFISRYECQVCLFVCLFGLFGVCVFRIFQVFFFWLAIFKMKKKIQYGTTIIDDANQIWMLNKPNKRQKKNVPTSFTFGKHLKNAKQQTQNKKQYLGFQTRKMTIKQHLQTFNTHTHISNVTNCLKAK